MNSVQKALELLLAFEPEKPTWGVRELSGHSGFSPATVQRLLQTLKEYAFIDQDPKSRQYRLGPIYYRFLHVLQSTHPVTKAALGVMERLRAQTGETVHLNLVQGGERICIDTLESLQNLRASMPVGNRSPLYAGASSLCLLAFSPGEFRQLYVQEVELRPLTARTVRSRAELFQRLEEIRRCGYAASLGERTPGLGSISAPIFNHAGVLLAALSLAIPELRYADDHHRQQCIDQLIAAAAELSRTMGYRGPYPKKTGAEEEHDTAQASK